jgi:hypothetical protein
MNQAASVIAEDDQTQRVEFRFMTSPIDLSSSFFMHEFASPAVKNVFVFCAYYFGFIEPPATSTRLPVGCPAEGEQTRSKRTIRLTWRQLVNGVPGNEYTVVWASPAQRSLTGVRRGATVIAAQRGGR